MRRSPRFPLCALSMISAGMIGSIAAITLAARERREHPASVRRHMQPPEQPAFRSRRGLIAAPSRCALRYSRSCVRLARVGEEQLLAADLVTRNRRRALRRYEPVDERLAQALLHVRMLVGIHQHDAVLVEEPLVA